MSNYKKIPNKKIYTGENLIVENSKNEPFVDLLNYKNIFCFDTEYYERYYKYLIQHLYVRESVFDKLIEVSKYLPDRHKLLIIDAWRPCSLQQLMFDRCYQKISREKNISHEGQLIVLTKEFVSSPTFNEKQSFPHATGGSIDVSIVDNFGNKLNMGTDYNFYSSISETNYYESLFRNKEIRENRRLLYDIMTSVGFTNVPNKWWHYDYGNSNWAYYSKKEPFYLGVFEQAKIEEIKKNI